MGESGSGKSTLLKTLYFDQPATSGEATLTMYQNGKANILEASSQQRRYLRNHLMGMVYQNPMLGLRMNISSGANIAEKLIAAGSRNAGRMIARSSQLLEHVEISGGAPAGTAPGSFPAACSNGCRSPRPLPTILPSCCWMR